MHVSSVAAASRPILLFLDPLLIDSTRLIVAPDSSYRAMAVFLGTEGQIWRRDNSRVTVTVGHGACFGAAETHAQTPPFALDKC